MKPVYGGAARQRDLESSPKKRNTERWSTWSKAGSVLLLCGAANGLFSCGSPQEIPLAVNYDAQEPQAQSVAQNLGAAGLDGREERISTLETILANRGWRVREAAEALVPLISAQEASPGVRERVYEEIYSLLPLSPQEENWPAYASLLMRISLLEGVGVEFFGRTIGLLEDGINVVEQTDGGYHNTAAVWLREMALSERCDMHNRERIVAFLERAFCEGGDIRRASIAPQLGMIAGYRTVPQEIRERIIARLESGGNDTEPLIRSYSIAALAWAERAHNIDEEPDLALRLRVVRTLSVSLNDADEGVRGQAARRINELFVAGAISEEHLDVIIPAIIRSPDIGEHEDGFPRRILGGIIFDNIRSVSPQARTSLVNFLGGWLGREESALRNDGAGYLGVIGASSGTSLAMRQQILQLLRRTAQDRNENVRTTTQAAIYGIEDAAH